MNVNWIFYFLIIERAGLFSKSESVSFFFKNVNSILSVPLTKRKVKGENCCCCCHFLCTKTSFLFQNEARKLLRRSHPFLKTCVVFFNKCVKRMYIKDSKCINKWEECKWFYFSSNKNFFKKWSMPKEERWIFRTLLNSYLHSNDPNDNPANRCWPWSRSDYGIHVTCFLEPAMRFHLTQHFSSHPYFWTSCSLFNT